MSVRPTHAGRLRFRLAVEEPVETPDDYGSIEITWSLFANRWGDIVPLSGRERLEADSTNAQTSHRIVMRHLDGITPKMRIVARGRIFNIDSIINLEERDRRLEILAREECD